MLAYGEYFFFVLVVLQFLMRLSLCFFGMQLQSIQTLAEYHASSERNASKRVKLEKPPSEVVVVDAVKSGPKNTKK